MDPLVASKTLMSPARHWAQFFSGPASSRVHPTRPAIVPNIARWVSRSLVVRRMASAVYERHYVVCGCRSLDIVWCHGTFNMQIRYKAWVIIVAMLLAHIECSTVKAMGYVFHGASSIYYVNMHSKVLGRPHRGVLCDGSRPCPNRGSPRPLRTTNLP